MEREKVHQKNLQMAEIEARKMLENVELEANMSAQEKLNKFMSSDDKFEDDGDTPGFIKTHINKQ